MADKTLSLNVFARAKASGFGVVARDVQKVHGGLTKLAGIGAALFAGHELVDFFKDSIAEARESQKVNAQTAAALKSTGGAAHVTAKQIGDLATAISNKTGIDDEQIQSSANMLLTFTNVRNEVGRGNDIFNQATQVVTDMSVALGQDGKSSAIQLGKALNDPIRGITALQRVGVTFTDQQKKQIKALVESGDRLGAQKIILKELTKEFGGSAAAQATAGDKLRTTWKNFQEQIGTAVLPILDKLLNFLGQRILPAFSKLVTWVQANWPRFAKFLEAEWRNIIWPVLQAMWSFLKDRLIPAYRAVIEYVIAHWPQIQSAFKTVWANIRPLLFAFRDVLVTLWQSVLKPIVEWTKRNWPAISAVAKVVFGAVVVAAKIMITLLTVQFKYWKFQIHALAATFGAIDLAWRKTYTAVKNTGTSIINWFKALPGTIKGYFTKAASWLYDGGKKIAVGLWNGIVAAWGNAADWFSRRLPKWIKDRGTAMLTWLYSGGRNLLAGLWGGITAAWANAADWFSRRLPNWIKGVGTAALTWLYQGGRNLLAGLWGGIVARWGDVADWFSRRLPKWLGDRGKAALTWLVEGGKNILRGLWNGIKAIWETVKKWFTDLPGHIMKLLGISSPPKWAIDAGKWIMKGMLHGLIHGAGPIGSFIQSFAAGASSGFARAGAGGGPQRNLPTDWVNAFIQDPNDAKTYAGRLMASYLWPQSQLASLIALWNGESGWRWNATNPSSGAYGIPQSLPADKMAAEGSDWRTNAATQIRWGLDYIKSVYGSPSNAYAAWVSRSPHWYDQGGWLPPGLTLAMNNTGRPERVIGPRENIGGINYVTINVLNGDPRAMVRELERYVGRGGTISIRKGVR